MEKKNIMAVHAVSCITSVWNNLKIESIMKCFNACGLSNASIETVLHLAGIDIVEGESIELSKEAGIEYDPNSSVYK